MIFICSYVKWSCIGLIKNPSCYTQALFFLLGVGEQIHVNVHMSKGSQRQKQSAANQMFDVARFRGTRTLRKIIIKKKSRQVHSE